MSTENPEPKIKNLRSPEVLEEMKPLQDVLSQYFGKMTIGVDQSGRPSMDWMMQELVTGHQARVTAIMHHELTIGVIEGILDALPPEVRNQALLNLCANLKTSVENLKRFGQNKEAAEKKSSILLPR